MLDSVLNLPVHFHVSQFCLNRHQYFRCPTVEPFQAALLFGSLPVTSSHVICYSCHGYFSYWAAASSLAAFMVWVSWDRKATLYTGQCATELILDKVHQFLLFSPNIIIDSLVYGTALEDFSYIHLLTVLCTFPDTLPSAALGWKDRKDRQPSLLSESKIAL